MAELRYNLSELEARALRWKAGNQPPAVWFKARLAQIVDDYQRAGGADLASLKDKLDRADPAVVLAVKSLLDPVQ